MKAKISEIILLTASVFYVIAEIVCAILFNDTLTNTYLIHTISELGIPNVNSPASLLMNSAFVFMGLALAYTNFSIFKEYITKNSLLFYVLTLVTSVGVIIVGLVHGGNPLTSGYHTLGAVMAILGGNILLILISKSMKSFGNYQKITCFLGIIGLAAFWLMFFNMDHVYMPVLERFSVYTLIVWSFMTGVYLSR